MNRSQKAALSGDSAFGHVKGPHDAVGFCANLRGGDGGAQFRLPRARLQGGLSSGQSRFARLTKGSQRRFLLIKQLVHGSQLLLQYIRIHADQQLTRTHRLPLAHIHLPHPARLQGDKGLFIRVGDNPLQQSGADQFPRSTTAVRTAVLGVNGSKNSVTTVTAVAAITSRDALVFGMRAFPPCPPLTGRSRGIVASSPGANRGKCMQRGHHLTSAAVHGARRRLFCLPHGHALVNLLTRHADIGQLFADGAVQLGQDLIDMTIHVVIELFDLLVRVLTQLLGLHIGARGDLLLADQLTGPVLRVLDHIGRLFLCLAHHARPPAAALS